MAKLYVRVRKKKLNKIIHTPKYTHRHTHAEHTWDLAGNNELKVAEGVALWGQIGWESSEQIGWFPRAIIAQCKPRSSWNYNLHINGNFD